MKKTLIATTTIFLLACGSEQKPAETLVDTVSQIEKVIFEKPLSGLEKIMKFTVDALAGGVIELDNGSRITVPENAFVNMDGTPVAGKVDLAYEEFHTLGDIIGSGIPMVYDSAGVEGNFVSAGMFTIDGSTNGTPVKVAPNKELEMRMASNVEDTPCYNFYELENGEDWAYQTTKKAEVNPNKPMNIIPEKPVETPDDALVFEIQNTGQFAEAFSDYQDILWKYDGNREDTINKKVLGNLSFGKTDLVKSDRSFYAYDLNLKTKGMSTSIPVKPTFSGKDLEAAQAKFEAQMASFKANKEMVDMLNQGQYSRTVQISGFGTYNWDVCNRGEREKVLASFKCDKDVSEQFMSVYLINPEDNMVVNYNLNSFDKFSYVKDKKNIIVMTLPGNEVAYMNAREFAKQNLDGATEYTFNLKMHPKKVESSEELDALIESI